MFTVAYHAVLPAVRGLIGPMRRYTACETQEQWEIEYALDLGEDGTFHYVRIGRGESTTPKDHPVGAVRLVRRLGDGLDFEARLEPR